MELDVKTEAYKLINETPLNKQPDDLMGYAGLRQIEDTIMLVEMAINDVLTSEDSINFYYEVLNELYTKYRQALENTSTYKPRIELS
jgi:hypothetical protein